MASWCASAESEFSIQNLPYGVFSAPGKCARVGVAIGEHVVDLAELAATGAFDGVPGLAARACFNAPTLNAFLGVRARL